MSTSSGKPPLDEQALEPSWEATGGRPTEAEAEGSSLDPPTQRQPHESAGAAAPDGPPLYGAGVPYGGDDRTEEIDPIALELPFAPEERQPAPAAAAVAAREPAPSEGREPGAPIVQVALSDLFDSVPSSSLAPPDPAAFASSPPAPPIEAAAEPAVAPPLPAAAAPPSASPGAVVPLPSIDIGAASGASRASARPAPGPAEGDAEPPARRSVPTLESIGNSTPSPAPERARAGELEPLEPSPDLGPDSDELQARDVSRFASDAPPFASDVPRFASEVPTSRPPDVVATPLDRYAQRERAAMATVAAPVTSHAGKAQEQLPSIILGQDVEAEPDVSARRALRAARATVRLELPKGFLQPGSPVRSGAAPVPASPPHGAAPHGAAPHGFTPYAAPTAASWLEGPRARRWLGALFVALLGALVLALALRARTGSLVVTALGPGSRAVDDVTIFVDDQPLCDVSPCRIKGLPPGTHRLRATAPNLASRADHSVEIESGSEATYNIELLPGGSEVRAGGLRVAAGEQPLTLYVDGKRVGRLPQEVLGLSSGKHWLRLDPEDGSPAFEKPVDIVAGETIEVDARPQKRNKALVTIRLGRGSEGAAVTLDDAFLLDFPAELELERDSVHTLSASKPGYEDLSMEVEIGPEETEKLIEVELEPAEAAPRKSRPKAARRPASRPRSTTATTQLADPTQGLLNISSVPPSQIILNGRPLGSTPKTGIAVPGDSLQTIVFVHPKMGRRRAQKFVPAGKERTVAIRF